MRAVIEDRRTILAEPARQRCVQVIQEAALMSVVEQIAKW